MEVLKLHLVTILVTIQGEKSPKFGLQNFHYVLHPSFIFEAESTTINAVTPVTTNAYQLTWTPNYKAQCAQ